MASLGKLVAGVAHEINNPNTFIRGNLRIIKEAFNEIFPILDQYNENNPGFTIARLHYNVLKKNIPVLVDDMINGVNRIKKIVDGLRNFARKNEGLLDDNIDINSIVYNCLRLIENQIRRSAEVKLNLAQSIPLFKGNFQKLEQVLVNMIINASQAVDNQQGTITIKTEYNEKTNEMILSIKDNGTGIDESALKYIFDPFFTTKRDRGGTGLGLSISYGIIKEHNGRIEVESKKGKGTTFTIFIPVTQGTMNEKNTGN
jgi:polar amino acid transport system substrate-binding protein